MGGNLLIIMTVMLSQALDCPMYFFLDYLSFMDVAYSNTATPNLLIDLLHVKKNISFQACITQLFLEHVFGGSDIFLLVVMAYDCPNVIDHFICDMYPLLKLVCADTYIIGLTVVANDGVICVVILMLLFISYGVILHMLKNLRQEGRRKAFSTCGSHITMVVFFFVPCMVLFVRPPSTLPTDKYLDVFYTAITPMLNPLIYTMRNAEMNYAMKKLWNRK
ncbi:Olfactory receptor 4A47 [Heterocephalus glaber]|uniref:Olfactory receptor 4A47 n=1 Tax=Heterocephalus glaber TaxID=10181 RepID=G5BIW9_HETGA|nr:Olfactory receptor 4A47 [Heterocephalus glaber]